jgi:hypothetical protein
MTVPLSPILAFLAAAAGQDSDSRRFDPVRQPRAEARPAPDDLRIVGEF